MFGQRIRFHHIFQRAAFLADFQLTVTVGAFKVVVQLEYFAAARDVDSSFDAALGAGILTTGRKPPT